MGQAPIKDGSLSLTFFSVSSVLSVVKSPLPPPAQVTSGLAVGSKGFVRRTSEKR